MSRVAYIENGKVTNVALGDADFAAATGGVFTTEEVSKGWSYDGSTFTAPPAPPAPEVTRLHRYRFAAELLTAAENDAWIELVDDAEQASATSRTQQQRDVLRSWRHFELAEIINISAPETQAAIYALHLWGVLTQERADRVAQGLPPA